MSTKRSPAAHLADGCRALLFSSRSTISAPEPHAAESLQVFRRELFWKMLYRNQKALRTGDWKYLSIERDEFLFNLAKAGAHKAYDSEAFVEGCREIDVTPHVAQNTSGRSSRIDRRTTRHTGYRISQFARKLIETVFGDAKQHGILRQVKLRGLAKVELLFTLAAMVVNLRRLPKLLAPEPSG